MRLVLEYGLKLPTTVVTIVNDFVPGPFRCQIELGHLGLRLRRRLDLHFFLGREPFSNSCGEHAGRSVHEVHPWWVAHVVQVLGGGLLRR